MPFASCFDAFVDIEFKLGISPGKLLQTLVKWSMLRKLAAFLLTMGEIELLFELPKPMLLLLLSPLVTVPPPSPVSLPSAAEDAKLMSVIRSILCLCNCRMSVELVIFKVVLQFEFVKY